MRIASTLLACIAAQATLTASLTAAPLSIESQKIYDTTVKPFLEANCVKCHGDKVRRAGFRIDTLGTDFLAGKTADQWKEIYDNIGVGKMLPTGSPGSCAMPPRIHPVVSPRGA
jgi:mono/diheme cytochrome c family protein